MVTQLKDEGVLTEAEAEAKKQQIIRQNDLGEEVYVSLPVKRPRTEVPLRPQDPPPPPPPPAAPAAAILNT